jgi:hypothetical protein
MQEAAALRKVLGRLVRRYVEVTAAPLRAFDRRDDGPIDLRDGRRSNDVIRLDPPARDARQSGELR